MRRIDYALFRKRFHIGDVLIVAGWTFRLPLFEFTRGECPLYCCEKERCCVFNMRLSLWFCHKCKQGGNALDLWCRWRNCDLWIGAHTLASVLGIEVPYI